MIYLVSVRTDVPAFYWSWFSNRLKEEKVAVRNPYYPEKVSVYSLEPNFVDCLFFLFIFYTPMLEPKGLEIPFDELIAKYPCSFSYTITCYDKDVEPYSWSVLKNIENFQKMSEMVGKQSVIWRFDPVFLMGKYTVDYHLKAFGYMAKELAPYASVCAFNFLNIYEKVKRNLSEARLPDNDELDYLMFGMKDIADSNNLILQSCGRHFNKYGFRWKPCTTMQDLEDAFGFQFKDNKYKDECLMCGTHGTFTRDVACYDSCLMGCKYCYATEHPNLAIQNYRKYDDKSLMLLDEVKDGDIISETKPKSYRKVCEK